MKRKRRIESEKQGCREEKEKKKKKKQRMDAAKQLGSGDVQELGVETRRGKAVSERAVILGQITSNDLKREEKKRKESGTDGMLGPEMRAKRTPINAPR